MSRAIQHWQAALQLDEWDRVEQEGQAMVRTAAPASANRRQPKQENRDKALRRFQASQGVHPTIVAPDQSLVDEEAARIALAEARAFAAQYVEEIHQECEDKENEGISKVEGVKKADAPEESAVETMPTEAVGSPVPPFTQYQRDETPLPRATSEPALSPQAKLPPTPTTVSLVHNDEDYNDRDTLMDISDPAVVKAVFDDDVDFTDAFEGLWEQPGATAEEIEAHRSFWDYDRLLQETAPFGAHPGTQAPVGRTADIAALCTQHGFRPISRESSVGSVEVVYDRQRELLDSTPLTSKRVNKSRMNRAIPPARPSSPILFTEEDMEVAQILASLANTPVPTEENIVKTEKVEDESDDDEVMSGDDEEEEEDVSVTGEINVPITYSEMADINKVVADTILEMEGMEKEKRLVVEQNEVLKRLVKTLVHRGLVARKRAVKKSTSSLKERAKLYRQMASEIEKAAKEKERDSIEFDRFMASVNIEEATLAEYNSL